MDAKRTTEAKAGLLRAFKLKLATAEACAKAVVSQTTFFRYYKNDPIFRKKVDKFRPKRAPKPRPSRKKPLSAKKIQQNKDVANKKVRLLKALETHKFLVDACTVAKVSRQFYYNHYDGDSAFREKVIDIKTKITEDRIDRAEASIDRQIDEDNFHAVKFTLETQGAHRGWKKPTEIRIVPPAASDFSDEQMSKMADALDDDGDLDE